MKIVHQFEDVALHTSKHLARTEGPLAWFTDGSTADLGRRKCTNVGPGDIRFSYLPTYEVAGGTSKTVHSFASADRLLLDGGDLYVEVLPSNSGNVQVVLVGISKFHDSIDVRDLGNGIAIRSMDRGSGSTTFVDGRRVGKPVDGYVEVHAPHCMRLEIKCRGSGVSRVHIPVASLGVEVLGSLNLSCASVADADIQIRGSGEVVLEEVTEKCRAEISGSGDVQIISGQLSDLSASVSGSGTIFAGVSVHEATLQQTGSGSILVAHVKERSFETQRGSGTIRVLKRGS